MSQVAKYVWPSKDQSGPAHMFNCNFVVMEPFTLHLSLGFLTLWCWRTVPLLELTRFAPQISYIHAMYNLANCLLNNKLYFVHINIIYIVHIYRLLFRETITHAASSVFCLHHGRQFLILRPCVRLATLKSRKRGHVTLLSKCVYIWRELVKERGGDKLSALGF